MGDSQPKAKYLVLDQAIPAVFKERLLGCVVNDWVDPSNGFQPYFDPKEDGGILPAGQNSDYQKLKLAMNDFLMTNADSQDQGKFKNQVNLKDLLTEKIVEGDITVDGSLTKLLKAHYSKHNKRNFEIVAATGKRYHLHNATYEFKNRLWSNQYYRDQVYEVIDQKRLDGTLETLHKFPRKYGTPKPSTHKCEVVILPMIVGILTCEEVKVNILDNRDKKHGAGVTLPIDQMAGIQTNGMLDVNASYDASNSDGGHTMQSIPDEVIVAVAYDLIAISTGNADPHSTVQHTDSRSIFSKFLGIGSPRFCEACDRHNLKKLPYTEAWRHCAVRTNLNRGANIHMSGEGSNHGDESPLYLSDSEAEPVELADAPIELFVAPHSDQYVLMEEMDRRLASSDTGSTTRSQESRASGRVNVLMNQTAEVTDKEVD